MSKCGSTPIVIKTNNIDESHLENINKSIAAIQESLASHSAILKGIAAPDIGDVASLMQSQQQVIANQLTIMQLELAVIGFVFAFIGWIGFKELKKYIFSVIEDIIIKYLEKKGLSKTVSDNNKLQRSTSGSVTKSLTIKDNGQSNDSSPNKVDKFKTLDYDPTETGE